MVVALLAIQKAGAAYIPMDPAFPKDRIAFMARDAGVSIIVTVSPLAAIVPSGPWRVVRIDQENAGIAQERSSDLGPVARADDLAYVIYTSGSTGLPKGVEIEHRSLVNFLTAMRHEPGLAPGDTVLSVTTLSFDIAGLEIWLPLTTGAQVVIT